MQPSSRRTFVLQASLLVLAATGWAAFAGAWLRVLDAERQVDVLRNQVNIAVDESNRLREASQKLFAQQDSLIRLQMHKLEDVQQRLELRETQLRQSGIPLGPARPKP